MRRELPQEIEPPVVDKFDFNDRRSCGSRSAPRCREVEASEFVRRDVKPVLETIPGVAGIQMFGRKDRAIRIWLDGDALRARGLAAADVLAALRREHIETPGGLVEGRRSSTPSRPTPSSARSPSSSSW